MSINTEEFISAVHSKPAIWQSKHPHHLNRIITRKLWSQIKDQFPGSEDKQLRKKWKNLRDQYRKEKKKIPTSRSGDVGDETEQSTWQYFQLMQFINDDITPEVMTGNLRDSDSESLNDSSNADQHSINDVMSPRASSTCSSHTNAPKRKISDYRNELIECERKKIELIEKKMSQSTDQSEKCDDYHFFMSLVPQMKQFSELQKLRIRNKITQVIIDEADRMQFRYQFLWRVFYGTLSIMFIYIIISCGTRLRPGQCRIHKKPSSSITLSIKKTASTSVA